jgi:hypothetical protein
LIHGHFGEEVQLVPRALWRIMNQGLRSLGTVDTPQDAGTKSTVKRIYPRNRHCANQTILIGMAMPDIRLLRAFFDAQHTKPRAEKADVFWTAPGCTARRSRCLSPQKGLEFGRCWKTLSCWWNALSTNAYRIALVGVRRRWHPTPGNDQPDRASHSHDIEK